MTKSVSGFDKIGVASNRGYDKIGAGCDKIGVSMDIRQIGGYYMRDTALWRWLHDKTES